ncbi:hypothetical protein BaRGS_00000275 [Batillaria attramentaria]|uniref:Uncharacterized protein n=1 Tax=Batillaria attramentaria TaxID=370345 RepID=A0ABD0MA59_9CAEN
MQDCVAAPKMITQQRVSVLINHDGPREALDRVGLSPRLVPASAFSKYLRYVRRDNTGHALLLLSYNSRYKHRDVTHRLVNGSANLGNITEYSKNISGGVSLERLYYLNSRCSDKNVQMRLLGKPKKALNARGRRHGEDGKHITNSQLSSFERQPIGRQQLSWGRVLIGCYRSTRSLFVSWFAVAPDVVSNVTSDQLSNISQY